MSEDEHAHPLIAATHRLYAELAKEPPQEAVERLADMLVTVASEGGLTQSDMLGIIVKSLVDRRLEDAELKSMGSKG